MKKEQVQIGGVYSAKITDKVVPVRIDAEHPRGGWQGTNLQTNRQVRIKSPRKLRSRITVPKDDDAPAAKAPVKKKLTAAERKARTAELRAQHAADQQNARLRDERDASPDGQTASERAMAHHVGEPAPATMTATPKPGADTGEHGTKTSPPRPRKTRQGMSCLAAAAKVLEEAGEPMNTKAMVEAMAAKGYWTSDAPTPAATLYSGILRELQKKGADARFQKVERGLFTLAKGA